MMKLLSAIPALPVRDVAQSAVFYRDKIGFDVAYQQDGFVILRLDEIEVHLWQASDDNWQSVVPSSESPVRSGAESFIAGTASCRIAMEGVEELYAIVEPRGIVHPNGAIKTTDYNTREFAVLDSDGNLVSFFERIETQLASPDS